ncbi:MAG: hypothetical protein EBT17_06090 [Actinobacteria bacterium]|nr:hypothetical protein [Actinomycetota bacterium]
MLTVDAAQREHAATGDNTDMLDTHRPFDLPFSDAHFVGESNGPHFRDAQERGADTTALIANELDRLGVGHPIDVSFDRFNDLPDTSKWGSDDGRNANAWHAVSVRVGRC